VAENPSGWRVLRISKSGVVSAWRERERQLRAHGANLTLLSAKAWEEGGTLVRLSADGDDFVVGVRTFGHHPNGFVYDPIGLWRVLASADWDLIDMQEEPFGLASAEVRFLLWLQRRRIPFVIFSAQNIEKRYGWPFRWFEAGALKAAAGAYPCNVEAGEIMRRKGLTGDLVVLGMGVDLDRFPENSRTPPESTLRVGFVGRLIEHKGVDVLLAALARDGRLSADIYGAGPEDDSLKALARDLDLGDRCVFHGHVDGSDVPGIYRTIDVLAVPSRPMPTWLEQFGRVVVEAQSSGVPVVASSSGALPDVVGDGGLLVPPGDPAALAAALGRFLDEPDLWSQLRREGLSSARQYSWRTLAGIQYDQYRRVMEGSAGPDGRRPRVAFLDHCALESGAEMALARLLPACHGIEPVVILGEDGPLVDRLRSSGIEVRVLPMDSTTRRFSREGVSPSLGALRAAAATGPYVVRLARMLRQADVDLVATNSLKSSLYGGLAGRLARVPVVWHLRDRIAPDYLPSPAVALVRQAARRLSDGIVANSATTLATLDLAGSGRSHPRTCVVGDACPADEFVRDRIPHEAFTVGLVGRISSWKGQDVFLRAFSRAFPNGGERARVVGGALFGEEPLVGELEALAGELGIADRVEFTGHRSDVPGELARLDALVHASTIPEPFGQVVVEAMAAGVPVVAVNAGGPSEVVTDGVDGLLYDMGDVEGLSRCLQRLASEPELGKQLVEQGHQTARRYDPSVIAGATQAFYAEVLARHRREARRSRS